MDDTSKSHHPIKMETCCASPGLRLDAAYTLFFNKSKPAAAPLNDSHSDLNFTAESFSGNEVGTVMFLSLPFH